MLDTARTFETPEGVDLQLHVAGPVVRALAWAIDMMIRGAVYFVLSIVLSVLGEFGQGVFLLCIFLLEWFYPVFFEVLKNGATPGKKQMGIRVVNDNGTPVSWSTSITRNLLRAADFAPAFYGFGLTAMLMNSDFKRLGDMAAGTIVIYGSKTAAKSDIPKADPDPLPINLSIKEQRAILDFAERSELLSAERREELANIIPSLTNTKDQNAVNKLYRYANWLYGKQANQ